MTWNLKVHPASRSTSLHSNERLEACFLVVMGKKAESDGYNALVLTAGLGWRDVALIRTFSRFLRQIRVPYSQDYMWATLRKYPSIAAAIVSLFQTRFDPHLPAAQLERAAREAAATAAIETALQSVESLDEDRILRHFVNAVDGGDPHQFLSARPRWACQRADRDQVCQPQSRRHAAAAAAL